MFGWGSQVVMADDGVKLFGTAVYTGGLPAWVQVLPQHGTQQNAVEPEQREALERALGLLEQRIGAAALARIQAGGAYEIRSKWWPNVVYLVPKTAHERVKVVADGTVVTEVCIVTTDPSLPWPDIMLQRLSAIEMDESILFETGVLHNFRRGTWAERWRKLFKRDR